MLSLIVPFVLQALQLWIAVKVGIGLPGYGSHVASIAAGCALIICALGACGAPLCVVYAPAMFYLLMFFTLIMMVKFFGEGP